MSLAHLHNCSWYFRTQWALPRYIYNLSPHCFLEVYDNGEIFLHWSLASWGWAHLWSQNSSGRTGRHPVQGQPGLHRCPRPTWATCVPFFTNKNKKTTTTTKSLPNQAAWDQLRSTVEEVPRQLDKTQWACRWYPRGVNCDSPSHGTAALLVGRPSPQLMLNARLQRGMLIARFPNNSQVSHTASYDAPTLPMTETPIRKGTAGSCIVQPPHSRESIPTALPEGHFLRDPL